MITHPSSPTRNIRVALLNTGSIIAKLPDIEPHIYILCFTETWLTGDQSSPHLADHQAVMRADRVTSNSKGGVLISVHKAIHVSHVILIETTIATLTLPNHGQLQITRVEVT